MVYETVEGEPVPPACPLVLSTTDEWLSRISDQLDELLHPGTEDTAASEQPDSETAAVQEPADPTVDGSVDTVPVQLEEPEAEKPKRRIGRKK